MNEAIDVEYNNNKMELTQSDLTFPSKSVCHIKYKKTKIGGDFIRVLHWDYAIEKIFNHEIVFFVKYVDLYEIIPMEIKI